MVVQPGLCGTWSETHNEAQMVINLRPPSYGCYSNIMYLKNVSETKILQSFQTDCVSTTTQNVKSLPTMPEVRNQSRNRIDRNVDDP